MKVGEERLTLRWNNPGLSIVLALYRSIIHGMKREETFQ